MGMESVVRAKSLLNGVKRIHQHGEDSGISTGWTGLDEHYTVKTGEMCVVTGVPSHGKSELLDALAVNLAEKHDWKFFFFSPENQPYERHVRKLIEKHTGQAMRKHVGGMLTRMSDDDLNQGIEFVEKHFSWLRLQSENSNLSTIMKEFCFMADYGDVKGFILDPWNEVEHHRGKNTTETDYISHCLSAFREFARTKDVALWIVAHPAKMLRGKDGNYPVPTLWDISGSAHWRNKADVGIVVHRPDFHLPELDVHVQKVRFKSTGKPGSVSFRYNYDSGRLKEKI